MRHVSFKAAVLEILLNDHLSPRLPEGEVGCLHLAGLDHDQEGAVPAHGAMGYGFILDAMSLN